MPKRPTPTTNTKRTLSSLLTSAIPPKNDKAKGEKKVDPFAVLNGTTARYYLLIRRYIDPIATALTGKLVYISTCNVWVCSRAGEVHNWCLHGTMGYDAAIELSKEMRLTVVHENREIEPHTKYLTAAEDKGKQQRVGA